MPTTLLLAGFLLAHGAIHLSFLSPRPPATAGGPAWPFEIAHSWLLSPMGASAEVIRPIGLGLVAVTMGAFALAALSVFGVLPAAAWGVTVALGAGASIALLVLFFHPWLVLGLVIDAVLLWAVIVAHWVPAA
jgi:hypothetical protein